MISLASVSNKTQLLKLKNQLHTVAIWTTSLNPVLCHMFTALLRLHFLGMSSSAFSHYVLCHSHVNNIECPPNVAYTHSAV